MAEIQVTDDIRAAAGALLSAAASGDVKAFAEAVSNLPEGQAAGFREPAHNRNALHVAALGNNADICSEAIDKHGFPPDEPDKEGRTALSLAAAVGNSKVIDALIRRNAKLDATSEIGATPLNYAAATGCQESLRLLLTAGASVDASKSTTGSPLLWSISAGKPDSVKALLKAGANPNSVNAVGASALAMAATGGRLDMVEALLKAGANPKREPGPNGVTALHAAANGGSVDAIKALIKAGADPEAKDSKGHKPIHEAAVSGNRAAVEFLVGHTKSDEGVPEAEWTTENLMKAAEEANRKAAEDAQKTPSLQIPEPEEPNPELAVTIKKQGDKSFREKAYPEALQHYTNSLRHDTSKAVVWANRSATLLAMERPEEALRDAQISRSIDKGYAKAWYREGKAAQAMGRWEDAACAYFEGHCVAPENKDLEVCFKFAIQEGKKAHAAQAE